MAADTLRLGTLPLDSTPADRSAAAPLMLSADDLAGEPRISTHRSSHLELEQTLLAPIPKSTQGRLSS